MSSPAKPVLSETLRRKATESRGDSATRAAPEKNGDARFIDAISGTPGRLR
jgi:hypothetical protein